MNFLHSRVFDPILESPNASEKLKTEVRRNIVHIEEEHIKKRDVEGMIQYYWSDIIGTEGSKGFAARIKRAGFEREEKALDEFGYRFDPEVHSGQTQTSAKRSHSGHNPSEAVIKPKNARSARSRSLR
jgi:hypothetical protein